MKPILKYSVRRKGRSRKQKEGTGIDWNKSQYIRKWTDINIFGCRQKCEAVVNMLGERKWWIQELMFWGRGLPSSITTYNPAHSSLSCSSLNYRGSMSALQSLHLLSMRLSGRSHQWEVRAQDVDRATASCPWQRGHTLALADVRSAVVSRHFPGKHLLQCWLNSNPYQEFLECSTPSTSLIARATESYMGLSLTFTPPTSPAIL